MKIQGDDQMGKRNRYIPVVAGHGFGQARLHALRQVTEEMIAQDIPIPPVIRLDETGQPDLIPSQEGVSVDVEGFWHDAVGPNVLEKLGRYETRLVNRMHRLLGELDRRLAQRVEGEIVG